MLPRLKGGLSLSSQVLVDIARQVTAPVYRHVAVRDWPKVIGRIHGMSVPSRVRPYPSPTPTSWSNINILLELLDSVSHIEGAIAECGVYRGSTLSVLALHLQQVGRHRKVYGFDSFEGFGTTVTDDLQIERPVAMASSELGQFQPSAFSDTSVRVVKRKFEVFGIENVSLVPGFFEHSLQRCPEERFAFVHLDCDTYSAYRDCLQYFYSRLATGAIVVFDEYDDDAWPGCNKAVDEFLDGKPERLESICRDNFVKSYFIKK